MLRCSQTKWTQTDLDVSSSLCSFLTDRWALKSWVSRPDKNSEGQPASEVLQAEVAQTSSLVNVVSLIDTHNLKLLRHGQSTKVQTSRPISQLFRCSLFNRASVLTVSLIDTHNSRILTHNLKGWGAAKLKKSQPAQTTALSYLAS